jgi:5-methylcytosine-specific restriction endonuclease McrA
MIEIIRMGGENLETICWKGGLCFICKKYPSQEVHHLIPKSLLSPFNEFIGICSRCHGLVHDFSRKDNHSRLTKEGLERARLNGKKLGRLGKKDKKPRSKIGYWKRWYNQTHKKTWDEVIEERRLKDV